MQLTLLSKRETLRHIERVFRLAFANGDQYLQGALLVDFTNFVNAEKASRAYIPAQVSGGKPPDSSAFKITQVPTGFDAEIIINPANPTLKNYIFKIASGNAELAGGAIPAAIYNDANGFVFSCVTPKKYG